MVIETVRQMLSEFKPAAWEKDLLAAGFVKNIHLENRNLMIQIEIPFAGMSWEDDIKSLLDERIRQVADIRSIHWDISINVASIARNNSAAPIPGVRNLIAVSSGKGGWVNRLLRLILH